MRPWYLLCLLGMLQGCTTSAIHVMSRMTTAGEPAYARETDLELAEPALAANLKLLEALLESEPRNATLLLQSAKTLAAYTYAFVEARLDSVQEAERQEAMRQRARQLYRRGVAYGLRVLSQEDPLWLRATSADGPALEELLRRLKRSAVPALLWTSFCWGGALNLERSSLETVALFPRLRAMLDRLLELDETYFYGLPHLLQAVHYAALSPVFGGNPVLAQEHFHKAHTLSAGRLLIVPLLEAQYYAVQVQDKELFTQRLQQVLDASPDFFPPQGLLNAVARQRASVLLRRIDALFF